MASTDDIKIKITAEDNASGVLSNIGGKLGSLGGTLVSLAKTAAVALAAAGGAIAAFGVESLHAFAEAEKELVIGNQALINSFGNLSKNQLATLQKEAGKGTDMLKFLQMQMMATGTAAIQLGFDDEEASVAFAKLFQVSGDVKQAQEDLKLAMDLSAFSGRDLTESAAAITKVHAGATRVLKEFGIEVKDGVSVEEALDLLHKRTANSAEAMAKTTSTQLKILGIEWTNLKERVGESLAVAVQPFIATLNAWIADPRLEDFLTRILKDFTDLINKLIELPTYWDKVINTMKNFYTAGTEFITQNAVIISIIDAVKSAFDSVWKAMQEQLIPAFQNLWKTLEPIMPGLVEFGTLFAKIMGVILLGALLLTIKTIGTLIEITAKGLAGFVTLTTWITNFGIKYFDDFTTSLSKIITALEDITSWAIKAWNALSKFSLGNVGNAYVNLPKNLGIPGFAEGGLVPGAIGAPTLAVVHGGETVIPAGRGGAGIIVNITGTFLSQDAADQLAAILINRLKMNLKI